MPLLSLPADILLEIFSFFDAGTSPSSDNAGSTLAAVSLVCKQLCAVAHRPLLKSIRWCDKKKTSLNLNQWQRNSAYTNAFHVPKKLVVAVEFDFETQSLDARDLDIILHERIYTRISTFSSLSTLVFSNTSISAQYLYPVILSLPMLRSLGLLDVTFSRLTHDNETDDTLSAVLNNYPFTSLRLTHLALRGVNMSVEMESTYEYHPINFLRVPSLQDVEIMWTPRITAAYMRHVHSKTGIRRQSGKTGWPNTDIPCFILDGDTLTEEQQKLVQISTRDTPLPLVNLTRLTLHVPVFDRDIIRALKMFLADCAHHPSFDTPLHQPRTFSLEYPSTLPLSVTRNTLLVTLLVEKCRLSSDLGTIFQGCLAPVVQYEGPLWIDLLSLFMDPKSLPLSDPYALVRVSSFHSPSPNEAEEREIDMPGFREVLHGLRALHSMSPRAQTTMAVGASDRILSAGIKVLEVRVNALDHELLYAIQQLFGSTIEKIAIRYAYHNGKSANTLLERVPDILSGLPHLRSFILMRIPDPSIVFARTALERHAAVVGDRQWYRWPGHHHQQPMVNLHNFNQNHPVPNFLNPAHFNVNNPHWNPQQAHVPEHLLTLEQFKQHTATLERAKRVAASFRSHLFGLTARQDDGEDKLDDDDAGDEEQEMRDHISGWGRICGSLWNVQIENYRFVRRYGEIGERWRRVQILS